MPIVIGVLILLLIANIVLLFQLRYLKKSDINTRLGNMFFSIMCIIIAEIIILFARSRTLAYTAFTLYYIFFAWYIMMFLRFSVAYSGRSLRKMYQSPFFWIVLAESVLLLWGAFSEQFFTITHMNWYGHIFWVSRRFPFFQVYAVINGAALLGIVANLVYAIQRSAKLYRRKYTSAVAVIVLMILSTEITKQYDCPTMVQAIIFGVCEIVIAYMALYYAPRKLNQRAMHFVANQLNDGIVLYNDEHELQSISAGYSEAFGLTGIQGIENEAAYWEKMIDEATVENAWNGQVKAVTGEEGTKYYEIKHMVLNEDGKVVGTVYWIQNVTESILNYRQMVRRANFDELTGIYNEAHFHESARQVLLDHPDTRFVMVCSSVEKYRLFRELFGREKYNEYLTQTAEMMKKGLSGFSTCRYGRVGETDFYFIMPKDMFHPQHLFDGLDRLVAAYNTNNFSLKVNVGVYEISEPPVNMISICNKALLACDALKGNYGRRMMWFDERMQKDSLQKEHYNAELSKAIENGEIQVYLQPQMNNDGKIIGAEALARWIHREEGMISPAQFIPYFEKNGRITELDTHIWKQVCMILKKWKERGREDLHISVNISPKDLYALDVYEHSKTLIEEYGIAPDNLKLEITESAVINDKEQHATLVGKLQHAGFEVEMDDFGSAYSSFNMLKDICVDVLKIDMKFLGETENLERSHAILKSIIDLAKELNMKIVAEGVETKEQLEFLRSVGCDIYQGYYISKPMPVAEFEEKYL